MLNFVRIKELIITSSCINCKVHIVIKLFKSQKQTEAMKVIRHNRWGGGGGDGHIREPERGKGREYMIYTLPSVSFPVTDLHLFALGGEHGSSGSSISLL